MDKTVENRKILEMRKKIKKMKKEEKKC